MEWHFWGRKPWRHYVTAFRDNLNLWAVWWPGEHVEVGDYGILEKGCFRKLGSLKQNLLIDTKDILRKPSATSIQLGGFGTIKSTNNLQALEKNTASATVDLDVKRSSGIFLRASNLSKSEFLFPQEIERRVIESIQNKKIEWNSDWLLVDRVISAGSFIALTTLSSAAILQVRGSIEALENLNLGNAATDNKVEISGQVDLEFVGEKGPIALGLVRVELPDPDDHANRLIPGRKTGVKLSSVLPQNVPWELDSDQH